MRLTYRSRRRKAEGGRQTTQSARTDIAARAALVAGLRWEPIVLSKNWRQPAMVADSEHQFNNGFGRAVERGEELGREQREAFRRE